MAKCIGVERLRYDEPGWGSFPLPGGAFSLRAGIGSGLSRIPGVWGRLYAVTDRGPNLFVSTALELGMSHLAPLSAIPDAKILPLPDRGPEVFEISVTGDRVSIDRGLELRALSARLSPCPLPGAGMERVFDLEGRELPANLLGADTEAVAALPDGTLFLAEEYGPSILTVEAGICTERWVAVGREALLAHPDLAVRGVLPEKAVRRRMNRGFEGLAASGDGALLYVGFQSGLEGDDRTSALIWKLDAATGALLAEHRYPFDDPSTFRRDAARKKVGWADLKVSELTWAGEDRLIVLERIAHTTKLYLADLSGPVVLKELLVSSDDHPEIEPDIGALRRCLRTSCLSFRTMISASSARRRGSGG